MQNRGVPTTEGRSSETHDNNQGRFLITIFFRCVRLEGINWDDPALLSAKQKGIGNCFMITVLFGLREYLSNPHYVANEGDVVQMPV